MFLNYFIFNFTYTCHWRHISWRGSCWSIITTIRSVTRLSWQFITCGSAASWRNCVTFIHSIVTGVSRRRVIIIPVLGVTWLVKMKTGNGCVFVETWQIFRHVWWTSGKIVVIIWRRDASCRHRVIVAVGWNRWQKTSVSQSFVNFSICNYIWRCDVNVDTVKLGFKDFIQYLVWSYSNLACKVDTVNVWNPNKVGFRTIDFGSVRNCSDFWRSVCWSRGSSARSVH